MRVQRPLGAQTQQFLEGGGGYAPAPVFPPDPVPNLAECRLPEYADVAHNGVAEDHRLRVEGWVAEYLRPMGHERFEVTGFERRKTGSVGVRLVFKEQRKVRGADISERDAWCDLRTRQSLPPLLERLARQGRSLSTPNASAANPRATHVSALHVRLSSRVGRCSSPQGRRARTLSASLLGNKFIIQIVISLLRFREVRSDL